MPVIASRRTHWISKRPATTITTVAFGQQFPYGITVDQTNAYWTNQVALTGSLQVAPIGGGAAATLGQNQDGATGIAADPSGVYWTNEFSGMVSTGQPAVGHLSP